METEEKTAAAGKRSWKKIGIITTGVSALLCVFFGWAYWFYSVQAVDRDPKMFSNKAQWVLWGMGMKQAYESDTYGGDTPEETLNMYIAALEAGDVSLAAKYYIPEKWAEKEQKLSVGKLNAGAQEKYLIFVKGFVSSPERKTSTEEEKYWISYPFSEDGTATSMMLVKNKYTYKWKIVEP